MFEREQVGLAGISSPGRVTAAVERLDRELSALGQAVAAQCTNGRCTQESLQAFATFLDAWRELRADALGAWGRFWGGTTMDQVEAMQSQAAEWRRLFEGQGVSMVGVPAIRESADEGDAFPWKWIIGGGAVAVGLWAAVSALNSRQGG